jgi:glycolate oxidase FAD binding subunit
MSAPATSALDPARYAIGGRVPAAALRPATRDEVGEAFRAAARDRLAVVPWGGGVSLPRETRPGRYDLALDLSALDRVVEYEPADMTLTAECGVTIQSLRALLATHGQELPLEAADAPRATLGGALAANASGPRRLRFGAPRDRILGARFCLGDGTIARAGGRVVKNVAGYALQRLLCGSRGGLGAVLEASLKLVPAPERRTALVYGLDAKPLADPARWAVFPRLEPAALSVTGPAAAASLPLAGMPASGFLAVVLLEDDAPGVARQAAAATAALGEPTARLDGDEAVGLVQALADLEEQEGPRLSFASAHNTPAALASLLDSPGIERMVFHAPAGRLHLFPPAGAAQGLVHALQPRGFDLIAARGTGALDPALPAQEGLLALRRRIRAALDPSSTLTFGERWESGLA